MDYRSVHCAYNQSASDAIRDDILEHATESKYEAYFITNVPEAKYDYHVVCQDFPTVSKDPAYIARCVIQGRTEASGIQIPQFHQPQPFKITQHRKSAS